MATLTIPSSAIPLIDAATAIAGKGPPVRGIPGGIATIGPKGLAVLSPCYQSLLIVDPDGIYRFGISSGRVKRVIPLGAVSALTGSSTITLKWARNKIMCSVGGIKRSVDDPGTPSIYTRKVGSFDGGLIGVSDVENLVSGASLAGGNYRDWTATVATQFFTRPITVASTNGRQIRRAGPGFSGDADVYHLSKSAVERAAGALAALLSPDDTVRVFLPDDGCRDVAVRGPDWTIWMRTARVIPQGVLDELPDDGQRGVGTEISRKDLLSALDGVRGVDGSAAWIGDRLVASDGVISLAVPAPCTVPGDTPFGFSVGEIRTAMSDWDETTVWLDIRTRNGRPASMALSGGSGAITTQVSDPTPEQRLVNGAL